MSDFQFENSGDLPPEEEARLQGMVQKLTDVSRKIGLYVENVAVTEIEGPGGFPRRAVMVRYTIGDVAFLNRVQDPEQDSIDKQFEEMATDMTNNEFLDTRERMKRNIEAGRDPLDDGDDE